MCPWHFALPARRGGKCGLAKAFGVGSARRLRIAFRSTAFSKQKRREDARTRRAGSAYSKSPATAGRNTTHKNLRKLATASSSCGELRKLSSIVVRISRIPRLSFRAKSPAKPELYAKVWRNLSTYFRYCCLASRARLSERRGFFFVALDLQHHALRSTGSECADGGTHSAR
jgi:hypothetical protein